MPAARLPVTRGGPFEEQHYRSMSAPDPRTDSGHLGQQQPGKPQGPPRVNPNCPCPNCRGGKPAAPQQQKPPQRQQNTQPQQAQRQQQQQAPAEKPGKGGFQPARPVFNVRAIPKPLFQANKTKQEKQAAAPKVRRCSSSLSFLTGDAQCGCGGGGSPGGFSTGQHLHHLWRCSTLCLSARVTHSVCVWGGGAGGFSTGQHLQPGLVGGLQLQEQTPLCSQT